MVRSLGYYTHSYSFLLQTLSGTDSFLLDTTPDLKLGPHNFPICSRNTKDDLLELEMPGNTHYSLITLPPHRIWRFAKSSTSPNSAITNATSPARGTQPGILTPTSTPSASTPSTSSSDWKTGDGESRNVTLSRVISETLGASNTTLTYSWCNAHIFSTQLPVFKVFLEPCPTCHKGHFSGSYYK